MAPTSSVPSAVAGAIGAVGGIGPGQASVSAPILPLASSYEVSSPTDLKQYRGKRVQAVGVVLAPTRGAGPGAANGTQMQLESVRVVGSCK